MINMNVIQSSYQVGVRRLVCLLSTCIYPDNNEIPIKETDLHNGAPHHSNSGYAFAKRMCELQCQLYREQYGCDFCCVVPTNLYGPFDNYSPDKSHVVAALIERSSRCEKQLDVWGSGSPLRQFCYVGDLCKLILWVLLRDKKTTTIALVPTQENSIRELAECIAAEFGIENINFDTSKEDGQFRKTMSNSLLLEDVPDFNFTDLKQGIKLTVNHFRSQVKFKL